jgi:hypothetical protein
VEIHRSARRHGVEDADIAHAVDHHLHESQPAGDEPPRRILYLGPDRAGNLLEIITLELDDESELAIHAMRMRPKYQELLPGRRRS